MATLSYGTAYCKEKYSVKAELAVLTVLQSSFNEEIDIGSKIPMLYDNLVDSAIVFSGNTAKSFRVFAQNACESLRTVAFARSMTRKVFKTLRMQATRIVHVRQNTTHN